jgi:hypothetical protein
MVKGKRGVVTVTQISEERGACESKAWLCISGRNREDCVYSLFVSLQACRYLVMSMQMLPKTYKEAKSRVNSTLIWEM